MQHICSDCLRILPRWWRGLLCKKCTRKVKDS